MRYKMTSDEVLILRDGRPFGDSGIFGGSSLKWPYPQTIAGMVRTSAGMKQDEFYFEQSDKRDENIEKILSLGISKILPSAFLNNQWTPLMPVPADLVLTENENNNFFTVNQIVYKSIEDSSGTDIKNRLWMIPSVDLRTKPAKEKPFFAHWDFIQKYLAKELTDDTAFSFQDIGINLPIHDFRVHNAIDNDTYVTEESRLFSNEGFYMKSKNGSILIDLAIFFDVKNADANISGDAYLGGERKRVVLTKVETDFLKIPDYFKNEKFLKIILTTHGDFGGWCPEWLLPNLDAETIEWVNIPGTNFEIRLRSACVNGWEGVSGWDVAKEQPKPMKKLVRPGAVYLIEIKDVNQSSDIAEYLWGCNLSSKKNENNGYGQCIVGLAEVEETV